MRNSAMKRLTACLLAFMLMMSQVAVADPETTGPVFSPVAYLGGYSVTFLDQAGLDTDSDSSMQSSVM